MTAITLESAAAGSPTLQDAYDASTGAPQITINSTPDPLTIDASVVGDVFVVRDVLDQDLLRLSTTGGSIAGGSNAGNILTLEGALAGSSDTGIVRSNSPVTLAYDTFSNTTPVEQFALRWNPTVAITGSYIGGALTVAPVVTVTTGLYIPATFSDTSSISIGATPGFSAFTFINELAVIRNSGNFNLPSALIMNIGLTHERNTAGTSTTATKTAISFSPQIRATVSGAVMTLTTQVGLRISPTHSTVAGSTVNYGTIIGMQIFQPNVALFQTQAGVENMTAYTGVEFPNFTFGGASATVRVINSQLNAGTNKRLINHTGTAASVHGGHFYITADNTGVVYGAAGFPFGDLFTYWNGSAYLVQFQATTDNLQYSNPAADRFLIDTNGGNSVSEYNFNCARFSLGAQTGAVGNQIGVFVAGAHTVTIGGEFSQFLLTQAANGTIDAALGGYFGWTINAPTPTIGTGSVTTVAGLNIGGNPSVGTNRVGLRILSNPSGGGGINAALWVTAGLSRFDGRVDINNGIALGGGAAATLGTIGGSGPTAAAQAQWIEVDVGGTAHWIPAWT